MKQIIVNLEMPTDDFVLLEQRDDYGFSYLTIVEAVDKFIEDMLDLKVGGWEPYKSDTSKPYRLKKVQPIIRVQFFYDDKINLCSGIVWEGDDTNFTCIHSEMPFKAPGDTPRRWVAQLSHLIFNMYCNLPEE